MYHYDTLLSFVGAKIYCHTCKSEGVIAPWGPRFLDNFMGYRSALDNDICLCNCHPPPRLLASQNSLWEEYTSGELTAMGFGSNGEPITTKRSVTFFDEQVRAVGQGASVGYPYFVRAKAGRKFSGRLDRSLKLPRVVTDDEDEYVVYWGDEALEKQMEA